MDLWTTRRRVARKLHRALLHFIFHCNFHTKRRRAFLFLGGMHVLDQTIERITRTLGEWGGTRRSGVDYDGTSGICGVAH